MKSRRLAARGGRRLAVVAAMVGWGCAALAPVAQADGSAAFSPVAGSPYAGAAVPAGSAGDNSVQFNPAGSLAAVTNYAANSLTIDSVAPGGALTATGNTEAVSAPAYAAFSPNGSLLAVLSVSGGIYVYSVGSGGALTAVNGSPFAAPSGYGMAWSADGSMLAAVGSVSGKHEIEIFSVGGGGGLTLDSASQTIDSGNPIAVAFSPSGGLLAVANEDAKTVGLYTVGSGAALTHVTDYSTGSSSLPYWVAFNPGTGSGTAQLALADYGSSVVDLFTASSSGLALQSSTSTGLASGPRFVTFSPDGLLATADAESGSVSVMQLSGSSLTMLPGSPMVSGMTPTTVSFGGAGGTLAASNEYGDSVTAYSVGAPTLTFTGPADNATYDVGQRVALSFTCADAPFAPGLSSCGAAGASTLPRWVNTSRIGSFKLSESAVSKDGQTAAVTVTYRVVGPAVGILGARVTHAGARVGLRCHGGTARQFCRGQVMIAVRHGRRLLRLGRARYHLRCGRRGSVTVRLSAAARRLISRRHRGGLSITISAGTTGRNPVTRRLKLR